MKKYEIARTVCTALLDRTATEEDRAEYRTIRREYNAAREDLVECHTNASTPEETVAALVERVGYETAAEIVAMMVICKGRWDGRIDNRRRAWAADVVTLSDEDLREALGLYYADSIHPAHLDQIAAAMMAYAPAEDTETETMTETTTAEENAAETVRTREDIIEEIVEYFEDNDDTFARCIEDLDNYNGYLGDDRYYDMDMLGEFYHGCDPVEILNRAYFGHDAETWHTDSRGERVYGAFNPNREYFHYNGYGNLVSSNYKDYSAHLDTYAVEAMAENRQYIDSIEDDPELFALFDELEGGTK